MNLNQSTTSYQQLNLSDTGASASVSDVSLSYNHHTSTPILYNLNFNQLDQDLKQTSAILYDTETGYMNTTTTNSNAANNLNLENEHSITVGEACKLKSKTSLANQKRQKKMKYNDDSGIASNDLSHSPYLYSQQSQNYFHKQPPISSSSITSSNSSSASSSPLSLSSPLHHQQHSHLQQVNHLKSLFKILVE
jgi:hypothetical protein